MVILRLLLSVSIKKDKFTLGLTVIAFRYLFRETLKTQLAVLFVLLLIFISQNFIDVLGKAANGEIPGALVGRFLLLNLPEMATLMLPVSLFIGILFAHGRLYAESEMTVMKAVGMGPGRIMRTTMVLALVWTAVALFNSLWLNPWAKAQMYQLREEVKADPGFAVLREARFMSLDGGRIVGYVEELGEDDEGNRLNQLFVVQQGQAQRAPAIVVAEAGRLHEREDGQWLTLEKGQRYSGTPGTREFDVAGFDEYSAYIRPAEVAVAQSRIEAMPTQALLNAEELEQRAELQWRLVLPLSMLVLTLIVVPLAVVNPRQGRYAKLLPAILLYLAYFLLQTASRSALEGGSLPPLPGLYTVPLAFLLLVALPVNLTETAWWNRTKGKFKRSKAA
ncbi:LPS export ABC transporter permease LptF [Oceanimonas baumannii]|uniref:LPS export ABC transporter permease LptF n=1 Tax=Oceanimonas baumannii TaxID=129578 RepID=UPI001D182488|nr:LPS export ABC transporter permease LptF [Oceanimonas baumannii]MCC4264968.1 LPS export ABC transporter permease LptF [Oceanimonas baumannii]